MNNFPPLSNWGGNFNYKEENCRKNTNTAKLLCESQFLFVYFFTSPFLKQTEMLNVEGSEDLTVPNTLLYEAAIFVVASP